ncbi:MAG: OmpA family protein [Myxococcota bacterium]
MLGMWIAAAWAQDLSFDAVRQVPVGSAPSVTFHAAVEGFVAAALDCGGRRFSLKQRVAAGASVTLPLEGLPAGRHRCAGQVRLERPGGDWAEAPLALDVAVLEALGWQVSPEDLDLAAHTLVVHPSRPLREAVVEVRGVGGEIVATETAVLVDPLAPTFSWTADDEVLALTVTGVDEAGISGTLALSPWHYAIPHDDVVFPTGQHTIPAAEVAKLDRCWSDVARVLDKYGDVVEIQLFVAGYTDTVGDAASNQALSERRARAIATWFVQRGFPGPVWFQGFGESALAVATADETESAANRRALYLLAAQRPATSRDLPRDAWQAAR